MARVMEETKSMAGGVAGPAELVVHAPLAGESRLAWRFEVNLGLAKGWQCVVDARDGRVLRCVDAVCEAGVAGRGTDMDGVSQALNVWQAQGTHYLIDTSKAMFKAGLIR